ncbi:Ig-like domain-containing protein, partial [Streptococcus pneumoniae]
MNAGEIKITFSKELDSTEAVDLTNYKIDGVTLDTAGTFGTVTPTLSDDKKSVTLALDLANYTLTNGQTYRVEVLKTLTDKAGNPAVAYDQLFKFTDNTAPTVVSSSYSDATKKFTIKFSEPLEATADTKVKVYDENNADVTAGTNRVTISADQKSIVVDASVTTAYTANKTYRVVMLGAKDLAGNYFVGNKVEANFKVAKVDEVAPTVTNFEVRNTKVVRVTFSEPIYVGAGSKIGELKVDTQGTATNIVVGALGTKGNAAMVNNDPKVWDITVDGTGLTGVHTIKIDAVQDLQGNMIEQEYVKLATFSADTTAPVIVSQSTAGTKLFLTFDESTVLTAGTPTVLNPDKVETTLGTTTPTNDNGNAKVVVIDFGAAITKAGTYTITIPSGMIKDAANQTKEYVVTANFTPADTT